MFHRCGWPGGGDEWPGGGEGNGGPSSPSPGSQSYQAGAEVRGSAPCLTAGLPTLPRPWLGKQSPVDTEPSGWKEPLTQPYVLRPVPSVE